ncbi:MAG: hypothetical protein L0387_01040 [Acidobacteria bacterium]|nr:hypothetical protein [Acidobacteriota bacterium]MCI0722962.1 hypothetical protein [Acidobacteriota bacterium]
MIAAGLAACLAWWFVTNRQQPSKQTLKVPDGFEVERVAGPPLVDRPIVADFDEQGRLYVADSSGSNDKVEKQLAEKPHRIVRLEDTNGDGRFDKSVVFADRMMFPEGAMWYDGSLYVSAPPSIWRLTDTNGDGVADQREEWFEGKTLTNCANDLHGPYLGPDGWIYWCKGAFGEQTHAREGKPPLLTRASHIFRRKPGSAFAEPVMVGGMDNPVDVAFTPGGERILTATFLQHAEAGRHTIGYLGGKVGPDLTRVGQVRTERDLLEAIVYPSASFVRSYEPLVIATKSGDVHNGVVRQENDDEILLATGPRSEVRIAQEEIKEMRPGTVSVMPAGLEEQLSRQELTDLMAFLKGTRWGAQ